MDSDDSLSDMKASPGDEPSSSAAVKYSDSSSEEKIPYEQQLQRAEIDSAGSTEEDRGPSGFTTDELIFQALASVYDDGNGNGLDFDGIYDFIQRKYPILDGFRERLDDKLGDLVDECEVEMRANRYKIIPGHFDTRRQSEEASNPTETMNSEDSTSTKPQDTPSTSSSFVPPTPKENLPAAPKENPPAEPEENPQIVAALKEVAEAEQLEFQAKEAQELADKHAQLLKSESHVILELAVEILNRCSNGEKVFLR